MCRLTHTSCLFILLFTLESAHIYQRLRKNETRAEYRNEIDQTSEMLAVQCTEMNLDTLMFHLLISNFDLVLIDYC